MRVVSLGSGSSGNALLVEAGPQGRTKILVDAGLSARMIANRLQTVGVLPEQLQNVLVTHEHSDHVQGIPMLIKKFGTTIIADQRTLNAIEEGMMTGVWRSDSGKAVPIKSGIAATTTLSVTTTTTLQATTTDAAQVAQTRVATVSETRVTTVLPMQPLPVGSHITIGDIEITSFATSHDAVAPCGYLLSTGGCRICLVTDSGEVTPAMLDVMQHADLLVLEANHDRERLLRGPYPWYLKQRILGNTGHLSNEQAAEALRQVWRTGERRWVWLAHLSRTNNTPEIALNSVYSYLHAAGMSTTALSMAALPHTMGELWDSTRLW
ncbi:MAG TPA: MBL fold metallo-hydrolase [Dictyobacter sp.]|jgi:phosphoribosyl 1,2-cyclic phosphodiesterase|nr:MBL fold metallo-hydrolase [Dictyobacter sp.]